MVISRREQPLCPVKQNVLLPESLLGELVSIHELYKYLNERVKAQDNKLQTFVSNNESAQLLKTTSGVGDTKTSNDRDYGGMLYCPLLGTVLLHLSKLTPVLSL